MVRIIAHAPDPGWRPYVPDVLYAEDGPILRPGWEGKVVVRHAHSELEEPFELEKGLWLCIGPKRPEPFSLAEEAAWRASVAKGVAAAASQIADPAARLQSLRAAAALVGVRLDDVVASAEAGKRSPGESLVDAYLRTRKR